MEAIDVAEILVPQEEAALTEEARVTAKIRDKTLKNNVRSVGRGTYNQGQSRNPHSQYQDRSKPARWDATFQAYHTDSKGVLEALKKLAAHKHAQE